MAEQVKKDVKLEIARLQALAADGIPVRVCGLELVMRPLPWLKARRIKDRLFQFVERNKEPKPGEFTRQVDEAMDEVTAVLAEVFNDPKKGVEVKASQFEEITAPELEALWLAFRECNGGVVAALGEVFAPAFRSLKIGTTGAPSTTGQKL